MALVVLLDAVIISSSRASVSSNPRSREGFLGLLWQISEARDPTWSLMVISATVSSDWGSEDLGLFSDPCRVLACLSMAKANCPLLLVTFLGVVVKGFCEMQHGCLCWPVGSMSSLLRQSLAEAGRPGVF